MRYIWESNTLRTVKISRYELNQYHGRRIWGVECARDLCNARIYRDREGFKVSGGRSMTLNPLYSYEKKEAEERGQSISSYDVR